MINLSEAARVELEAFFVDKPKAGIRIFLAPGGWRGPRLSLALDESTENDKIIESDGFSFCIATDLLEQVGGVTVDMTPMGFTIEPTKPLGSPSACGSCSTGTGSCSI